MKVLNRVGRHLSWKLFLSYLVVILVSIAILATATELAVPTAFDRHMGTMAQMMDGQVAGMLSVQGSTS